MKSCFASQCLLLQSRLHILPIQHGALTSIMSTRKAPPGSPQQGGSARKKAKSAAVTQTGIGAFLQSPPKQQVSSNGKANGKTASTAVVDLLSDDEVEEEEDCKPPTSKAGAVASTSRDVIDLEDIESDAETDSKPRKSAAASLHPMFAARPIKIDEDEDVKDVKPDLKGKGKAKPQDSPTKLVIPEGNAGDPVVYPLDTDIFEFDPHTDISTATWPRNSAGKLQIPYSFLVAAFVLVSATRSRLSIVTVLTNALRTVVQYQPEILRETVYLVTIEVYRWQWHLLRAALLDHQSCGPGLRRDRAGCWRTSLGKGTQSCQWSHAKGS